MPKVIPRPVVLIFLCLREPNTETSQTTQHRRFAKTRGKDTKIGRKIRDGPCGFDLYKENS